MSDYSFEDRYGDKRYMHNGNYVFPGRTIEDAASFACSSYNDFFYGNALNALYNISNGRYVKKAGHARDTWHVCARWKDYEYTFLFVKVGRKGYVVVYEPWHGRTRK